MIEQDTRYIIDSNLTNKHWILNIKDPQKNVFFESDILRKFNNEKLRKCKKRPDYAKLETVVSLPQGTFLPYTGVKTDILYFYRLPQSQNRG